MLPFQLRDVPASYIHRAWRNKSYSVKVTDVDPLEILIRSRALTVTW